MALAITDPARRMIGHYLIDMVDEAGYLTGDLDSGRRQTRRPASAEVEAVLASCKRRSARRLRAQSHRMPGDPAQGARPLRSGDAALVEHLDLLAKRDLAALRRCAASTRKISRHDRRDPHLNPKPGLAFGSTLVQPIVPDVFVRAGAGRHLAGRAQFRHAAESPDQPALLRAGVEDTRKDSDKTYLADCLQTATWLVRALDQRAKTILKVSSEIVRQQDAFFARASSICGRSISRPWPTPSACTSRPSRASPPTNTWRRPAASLI